MRVRIGVSIFTGLVAFAPSLVYFLVFAAEVTPALVAEWTIPVALWLLAWTRIGHRTLLPFPIALFMTLVVAVPVSSGFEWPRLAGIALALAVTAAAVSGLAWTLAWSVYGVALLTVDYSRVTPHAGHLSTSALDAASTILGILVIPAAMAVVSQQWGRACQEGDAATETSRAREAQARSAERAEAARAAVDRRIHETVLNTLATIARARTSAEGARAQCAEDLRALDSVEATAPRSVRDMLGQLLERHPVPQPTLTVVAGDVAFRDDDMANAASVAVGEVLRNVTRHARATRTLIQVQVPRDRVTITVTDDGIGMDDTARRRFGMRRALIESVESAGGTVHVTSEPSAGTAVTLSLPLARKRMVQPPPRRASIDVLLGPPRVRVAMTSALVIGLLLLLPASLVFAWPLLIVVSYIALAGAVILLALRWESRRIAALAWLSLAAMIASQAVAWAGVQGCVSSGGLHQMLFTTAAAMLLPPLALRTPPQTLTMVALVVIPTVLVPWSLPAECRNEALVPAIETGLWVITLVGIIATLSRAFDRSSVALASRWDEIADAEGRLLVMQAADQRWRSVDSRTRALLASVADGTLAPGDPDVRASATRLEARIRSLLEISTISSPELRSCLEEVVDQVTGRGRPVTVIVVSDAAIGPMEPSLQSRLIEIGRRSSRSGLHLTVLDDEILVSADRAALDSISPGALGETDDPDIAVAVLRWETTEVHA